ncbi:H-NS family nucleoid-associated regulatory protein [Aestuariibius sp. HNIBRBA575]|uniref:H-NS histone family protein n=1 Tax=Aestuariibius sp. HNIBRBA575 TaxID=3233343 RepID=UPI0034A168F2
MDIRSLSRKELEKLKAKIDKQLEKLANEDKKAALIAAEKAAKAHGFSLSDLTGQQTAPKRRAKTPSVAKYRNPADATQTWTGRGRQPIWFKDALASGNSAESMEL